MPLFIAADGGGTKTDIALFDLKGKILSCKTSGGSNPIFMDLDEAVNHIKDPIEAILKEQKLSISDIESIVLFIPGMSKHKEYLEKSLGSGRIEIYGDEMSAFYGALGGEKGIAVLSGTGSFAVGKNDKDEMASVGGWGLLFGDQGSGYYIGIECLKAAARLFDMGLTDKPLVKAVKEHFKIDDFTKIRRLQTDPKVFNREKISELSFVVENCARAGDVPSLEILDKTALELADIAYVCSERLHMSDTPYKCSFIGGISNIGHLLTDSFRNHLKNLCPNLTYIKARFKPTVGAILYVMEQHGVEISKKGLADNLLLELSNFKKGGR